MKDSNAHRIAKNASVKYVLKLGALFHSCYAFL
jgi:hypothetical protein